MSIIPRSVRPISGYECVRRLHVFNVHAVNYVNKLVNQRFEGTTFNPLVMISLIFLDSNPLLLYSSTLEGSWSSSTFMNIIYRVFG